MSKDTPHTYESADVEVLCMALQGMPSCILNLTRELVASNSTTQTSDKYAQAVLEVSDC